MGLPHAMCRLRNRLLTSRSTPQFSICSL